MRKRAFRGLALLLMFVMLTALAACGQGEENNSQTSAQTTEGSSGAAASFEPVQIDVFSLPSNDAGLYDQTWWGKMITEKTGAVLNVLPSGGDEGSKKLQAFMASGELPDVVIFMDNKDVQNAIRANLLVNLDEHLDKLPNVAKNADSALQYYRDNVSNGTGKLYTTPSNVGPQDQGPDPDYGPFIRWDLYKQAGMPEINTYEDYLPVLKAMQKLYPKTPDGKKVYGFTLWKDWDGAGMAAATGLAPFEGKDCGDDIGGLPYLQADYNTMESINSLDPNGEYLRAVRFFYQANQMGLLDPDSLTQNFDTARSKATEGRVLYSTWSWFCSDYNTDEHLNAENPTGFLCVPPKNSKSIIASTLPVGEPWSFSISSKTKKLDTCLRYLDFLYSVEGVQELEAGPKGVTWDVDGSGKPSLTEDGWKYYNNGDTELPDGGTLEDGQGIVNFSALSDGFINPATQEPLNHQLWSSSKEKLSASPNKLLKDWQSVYGHKTSVDYLKANNMITPHPLAATLIPPVTDEIDAKAISISDIVRTYSWLMVFAKDDAEYKKLSDEMIDKAKGLGLDEVYQWSANAWKEAQEKANKYE